MGKHFSLHFRLLLLSFDDSSGAFLFEDDEAEAALVCSNSPNPKMSSSSFSNWKMEQIFFFKLLKN
jgi:hypothetical protein